MRAVFLVLLMSGCANGASSPPPPPAPASAAPAPVEAKDPPLPFLAVCREACAQRNAPRAVAAQMIDAECTGGCIEAWHLPAAHAKADLAALEGKQVRVFGRLREGPKVTMRDGTALAFTTGLPLEATAGPDELVLVGSIEKGALVSVTVIAPSGN